MHEAEMLWDAGRWKACVALLLPGISASPSGHQTGGPEDSGWSHRPYAQWYLGTPGAWLMTWLGPKFGFNLFLLSRTQTSCYFSTFLALYFINFEMGFQKYTCFTGDMFPVTCLTNIKPLLLWKILKRWEKKMLQSSLCWEILRLEPPVGWHRYCNCEWVTGWLLWAKIVL